MSTIVVQQVSPSWTWVHKNIPRKYAEHGLFYPTIAVSDGTKFRLYGHRTKRYKGLITLIRDWSEHGRPLFIEESHSLHAELAQLVRKGCGSKELKIDARRISHSLPVGSHSESPVDFCCPKCEAPYPSYGNKEGSYYNCRACGYSELDLSSLGI